MKIDAEISPQSPSSITELAVRAEEFGFDCLWVNETKHDPFIQLAVAALGTSRIRLGTSIALAFTRSPTNLAYSAWDIQNLSRGRLILGLGTQVKGHIERRFGMKWESPSEKMKETIDVIRAVWRSWQTGAELDYSGRFFSVNLMTPFFNPGPIENPSIPVFVAAVNRRMCRIAGRVADGLHVHPLHTPKYLMEVMLPSLTAGLREAGRQRGTVQVAASVFVAAGDSEAEVRKIREFYREQIAFYASTRTYRKVLELHGWGEVCDRLHGRSVSGEWSLMKNEITDDILSEFVVEGGWDEIGDKLRRRYGEAVDRVRLYIPFDGKENWRRLVEGFDCNV